MSDKVGAESKKITPTLFADSRKIDYPAASETKEFVKIYISFN